jgi:hypothetical protein
VAVCPHRTAQSGFKSEPVARTCGETGHLRITTLFRKVDLRFQVDHITAWLNHTAVTSFLDQPIPRGTPPYGSLRLAVLVLKTGAQKEKP